MNDYDPRELIALCEAVLEDGEITYDEAYELADWLNNHREACFNWPGDSLVRPLQQAWADAKLTKTELRMLAKLLRRISKEWSYHQTEQFLERVRRRVQELASTMPPHEPLLPPLDITLRIRSSSEPGLYYDVCLVGPSCTCPDWTKSHRHLPESHLSRACKHVLAAYSQIVPAGLWRGWLGAFLDIGWRAEPLTNWRLLEMDQMIFLLSTAGATGWANVYCELDSGYERYGYSVVERRWSYGNEPPSKEQLARVLCLPI